MKLTTYSMRRILVVRYLAIVHGSGYSRMKTSSFLLRTMALEVNPPSFSFKKCLRSMSVMTGLHMLVQ